MIENLFSNCKNNNRKKMKKRGKKMKNIKKKIILGSILVSLIMLVTPIMPAQTNQSMINPPQIRPIGGVSNNSPTTRRDN